MTLENAEKDYRATIADDIQLVINELRNDTHQELDGRAKSLVITKLEEAQLWTGRL